MSTTVSYKGQTLTTVSNDTKTLLTEGKYLEDDLTLTDVSGSGATLITKNISANGTYNASSDSADGYSQVTVAVPASAVDTGTKSISTNGTHDVTGYASANVNVPNSYSQSDEGKVVSNGALVAQTSDTVTTNDTYDTTLINSLTVNVGGDDAVMRQVVSLGGDALKNAVLGEVANFSSLTYMGEHAFQHVSGPKIMVFPKISSTGNYPVSDTLGIETIDMGSTFSSASFAGSGWFFSANAKLTTLILRKSSVIGMPNINCFHETPFASDGTGGTLYVPQSLISSYQSASNWSTILGYAHNSIVAIEGSQYENYYADGTPVT